ncbi:MAG: response regulator [Chloroflexi bacterium]|nr:response regulator [Chloroflexota bacterium]
MAKGSTNKAKVLVVDDEARIREIVSRRLTEAGYQCTTASDGSSALKKLKTKPIDLVLLDINMPGKSGVEVLKEIKGKYSDTAIIMVTAIAEVETAINAMKLGAYDYIIKPVDHKILLISADRALEKRRLILENKAYQLHLEEKVKEQTEKIRQSFLSSITSLARALEAKDAYTSGHSERVTKIAVAIAEEMNMPEDRIEKIRIAGLLHDIGKIGVMESVLSKPDKLTNEEFEHVKSHCEIGQRILSPIIEDEEILDIVVHHHERYDGTGYPHRLSAEQISPGAKIMAVAEAYDVVLSQSAKILAVADAYDAMTSKRPYRPAMSHKAACAELEKGKGTQFDPAVVDALLQTIAKLRKL